jgi:hypothetical protein
MPNGITPVIRPPDILIQKIDKITPREVPQKALRIPAATGDFTVAVGQHVNGMGFRCFHDRPSLTSVNGKTQTPFPWSFQFSGYAENPAITLVLGWQPRRDSNPNNLIQSQMSYH